MFEASVMSSLGLDGVDDEPLPGDEHYEAFRVWEAQQDAFWSAYAARELSAGEAFPDLSGMRTDAGLLREVQEAARGENRAAGAKLQAIVDFALRRMAQPEVGYDQEQMQHAAEAELGVMLGVNPSTASYWVHLALSLTRRLPRIFAALKDGDLSWAAVRAIEEESANLDVAQCARLEDAVLAKAAGRSPSSMRKLAKREVKRIDPDAVRKRREAAIAGRGMWIRDEPDGMATLCASIDRKSVV